MTGSAHYNVEISFIQALTEYGLVEITTVEATPYILNEHIGRVEKLMHLHYDLDINMEGIDAISHLLQKVEDMRHEINTLQNRLRFFEHE